VRGRHRLADRYQTVNVDERERSIAPGRRVPLAKSADKSAHSKEALFLKMGSGDPTTEP
jgi:hypothetical protein